MKGAPARDTHALPPEHICQAYWKYNKISTKELQEDLDVVDFRRGLTSEQRKKLRPVRHVDASTISAASRALRDDGEAHEGDGGLWGGEEEGRNVVGVEPCTAYEHADFPGGLTFLGLCFSTVSLIFHARTLYIPISFTARDAAVSPIPALAP